MMTDAKEEAPVRINLRTCCLLGGLTLVAAASSLQAQEAEGASGTPAAGQASCEVVPVTLPNNPQMLEARCGTRAVLLGQATEYTVAVNPELDATVIDMGTGPRRQILLLRMREDGEPIVEDMSTTVALAAGKSRVSPIDDVTVDLDAFAGEGELGVSAAAGEGAEPVAQTIDVGDQVTLQQASEAAVPAQ